MRKTNESGFTLTEWLIGLGVGLSLLVLVCELYLKTHKITYFTTNAQEMRSNERLALNFLAYDIRMAGFIGCPHSCEVTIPYSPYRFTHDVSGSHSKLSAIRKDLMPKGASKESSILYLQYADPDPIPIVQAQGSTIRFQENPAIASNTIFLISDCRHAEIFQAKHRRLKFRYANDATVRRFYRIVYYIAQTDRLDNTRKPIYALYRQDLNSKEQPAELVEHIDKLTIHYGIVSGAGNLDYVTADQVLNWQSVRNLTITLEVADKQRAAHQQVYTTKQTTMIRSRCRDCLNRHSTQLPP